MSAVVNLLLRCEIPGEGVVNGKAPGLMAVENGKIIQRILVPR